MTLSLSVTDNIGRTTLGKAEAGIFRLAEPKHSFPSLRLEIEMDHEHSPTPTDTIPPTATPGEESPREFDSADLLRGEKEVLIHHAGEVYRLRLTRNDKLILQK